MKLYSGAADSLQVAAAFLDGRVVNAMNNLGNVYGKDYPFYADSDLINLELKGMKELDTDKLNAMVILSEALEKVLV